MNGFEKIINSLSKTMTTPLSYGWFHLVSIFLVIIATILICIFLRNCHEKAFRIFVFVCWTIIFVLEIYKQIVFSFENNNGIANWDYQWYAFPFQFCSLQLYLLPFIIFLKNCKLRDAIIAFILSFSFFGGLVVYIYPGDVFVQTIGINIQTMIHHGFQIIFGIFFAIYFRKKLNLRFFVSAVFVFISCVAIALTLNLLAPYFTTESFNMFYISPYINCTLPVLSTIYSSVPYLIFLLIYIFGFSLAAFVIFLIFSIAIKFIKKNAR